MNQTLDVQKEKLMQDLRVVMRDAEDLLKSSGQQLGDGAALWRERTQDRLTQVREHSLPNLASAFKAAAFGKRVGSKT